MIRGVKIMFLIKRKKYILAIFMVILLFIYLFFIYDFNIGESRLNTQALEQRIISLGELATLEYHYQNLFHYKDTKELKGIELPFTEKTLLILYEGYIKAGVDLTEVSIQIEEGKNITLELKTAYFTDNVINEESVQVYDEKSGLFNPLKLEEVFDLLEEEKKKTQQELKKDGFLGEANAKAEKLLIPMLEEMGFKEIEIEFQD